MVNYALRLGLLLFSLVLASSAQSASFTGLYTFGDSLSDTGVIGPPPPYYMGRFSNGPIWIDGLAANLGLSSESVATGGPNYAVGGATTGDVLTSQIPAFSTSVAGAADAGALYVVWAGGNDGLGALDPTVAAANIGIALDDLAFMGADSFLVPNLADLSLTPDGSGIPGADLWTAAFNASLAAELAARPALTIYTMDTFALTADIAANPGTYGFTDVTNKCFDSSVPSICADPSTYAWWDGVHPTSAAHGFVADLAIATIPEPGTGLLLAIGLISLGARRSRKAA